MYIYIYRTHTHTHTHAHIYTHKHTHANTHTHSPAVCLAMLYDLILFQDNCHTFQHTKFKFAHISFWINPTGHSKFHNISNHPPPATDSGRTSRTPLYPPVQAVPPYSLTPFFSCPGQRNRPLHPPSSFSLTSNRVTTNY